MTVAPAVRESVVHPPSQRPGIPGHQLARVRRSRLQAALVSLRRFWQLLLHNDIRLSKLTQAVRRIDESVKTAEKVYFSVLQRHNQNARLMR